MAAWQQAATTNPETITNWFTKLYPNHGLGIATGQLADGRHLFVLDVDDRTEYRGSDTLDDLTQVHGPLPDTVEVLTGSGGRHIYFVSPVEIRNDAGTRLGVGLDIRGEGGQVVAPPTIHKNGSHYEWVIGYSPDDIDFAPAPEWLLNKLVTKEPPKPVERIKPDAFMAGDSIADRYNANTTWTELLTVDGWTLSRTDHEGVEHWTRPGKSTTDGTSATVGYKGLDILRVFTSSLPWLPEKAYSRFQYFAHRHHGGDMSKAARALNGTPLEPAQIYQQNEEWGEAIPLLDVIESPPFPIDTLPNWLADYAVAVADDLQVAVDLAACLGLGALSVAALGNSNVQYPRQNWSQPLNLYITVAMPPSAGKSPAKAALFSVLEELETRRIGAAAANLAEFEANQRIKEKAQRANEEKAAKSKGIEADIARDEARSLAAEIALMTRPPTGKLLVDDVTAEALGVELANAGGAIAVVSAEGGLWDRLGGLYQDGVPNLDLYLEAFSGGRYQVSRIGRPPILVPRANLVVITTVQPGVLDAVGAKKEFAARGLTARFLLSLPKSNVGKRDRLRPSKATPFIRKAYESTITEIADLAEKHKPTLVVDGEASDIFARWDQGLEDRLGPGEELEHLAEWVGKLRASVLRIAALLHLAHGHPGIQVTPETMRKAIALGEYFLGHAQSIIGRWGTDGRLIRAEQVLGWLRRKKLTEFSARDMQRMNNRLFATIEETRGPLEVLIERGWIRPLFDGPLVLGRRGMESPRFAVRPEVHDDMHDNHDRLSQVVAEMSCMSRMSPNTTNEGHSLSLNTQTGIRGTVDKHDMQDNSHWSGLL
jgi:hypothetical protein